MRKFRFRCPECLNGWREVNGETGRTVGYEMGSFCNGCIDMMALDLERWLAGTAADRQQRVRADVTEDTSYGTCTDVAQKIPHSLEFQRSRALRTELCAETPDEWELAAAVVVFDALGYVPKVRRHQEV